MKLSSKKGFTLIELIIVIAILGIIALIAIPNLAGIRQRSQINADIRTGEQIGKSVRIWQTDTAAGTRVVPTTATKLDSAAVAADAALEDLDDYISYDYTPKSLTGGYYYIKAKSASDDKVVVFISSNATGADYSAGTKYNGASGGEVYVEK